MNEIVEAKRSNQPRIFRLLSRFVTPGQTTSRHQHDSSFDRLHIPGLIYAAHNLREDCGHIRLFGKPNKGVSIYNYHHQSLPREEWALHRVWNFVLFAIHHVGPGKATDPAGWHVTFATLKLERKHGEIALRWRRAETFRTGKRPVL